MLSYRNKINISFEIFLKYIYFCISIVILAHITVTYSLSSIVLQPFLHTSKWPILGHEDLSHVLPILFKKIDILLTFFEKAIYMFRAYEHVLEEKIKIWGIIHVHEILINMWECNWLLSHGCFMFFALFALRNWNFKNIFSKIYFELCYVHSG